MMITGWIVLYLFMAGYMFYLLWLDEKEIPEEHAYIRCNLLGLLLLAIVWPATCILYLIAYIYDRIVDEDA
ncbi:hypothetical protein Z042_22945 [Chania multitudinisentens RB-25]|uniref:Uncharacterized protein n=1 Tax=Chania multitudinisentens RB-25 TaxID=1441930 RepID=W0LLR0_9GAMM|nr:hypothetical protein [Chania multitudinisentens]AHG22980.1 hypothetical protein Z042_22945 [Chania multitudinisentens RB-25]